MLLLLLLSFLLLVKNILCIYHGSRKDGVAVLHQLIINKNHILDILKHFNPSKKIAEISEIAQIAQSFLFFDDNTRMVPSIKLITSDWKINDKWNPVTVAAVEEEALNPNKKHRVAAMKPINKGTGQQEVKIVTFDFNIEDNIQCHLRFKLNDDRSDFDIFFQLTYNLDPNQYNDAENFAPFVRVNNLYNLYFSYLGSEHSDFYNIMARETIFSNFLSVTSNKDVVDLRKDDKSDREIAIEHIVRLLISETQRLKDKVELETLWFIDKITPDYIDIAYLGYINGIAVKKYIQYEDYEDYEDYGI